MYACLVQLHGALLLKEGAPLLDVIAAAMDGERDPRCLMLAFACVQTIAELHKHAGQERIQASSLSRIRLKSEKHDKCCPAVKVSL